MLIYLKIFILGDHSDTTCGKVEGVVSCLFGIFIAVMCFLADIPESEDVSDGVAAVKQTIEFFCHSFMLTAFAGEP